MKKTTCERSPIKNGWRFKRWMKQNLVSERKERKSERKKEATKKNRFRCFGSAFCTAGWNRKKIAWRKPAAEQMKSKSSEEAFAQLVYGDRVCHYYDLLLSNWRFIGWCDKAHAVHLSTEKKTLKLTTKWKIFFPAPFRVTFGRCGTEELVARITFVACLVYPQLSGNSFHSSIRRYCWLAANCNENIK